MYPFRSPAPSVRIGETVDEFAHNWEVGHGTTCTDMLPHRDVNWQLFMWSESCEGPPPPIAPPGRKIDQYGNIIHDEPQVTPFQPGAPAPPGLPAPSPYMQAVGPLSPAFTLYNPLYGSQIALPTFPTPPIYPTPVTPSPPITTQPSPTTPPVVPPAPIPSPLPVVQPAPIPSPPPVVQPAPIPTTPPVVQPAPAPAPASPIQQVPLPSFPIPLPFIPRPIPTGPFRIPPDVLTPTKPIVWESAPTPAPPPAPTTSRWHELGVTLLMLAPALIPLALTAVLPEKRRRYA